MQLPNKIKNYSNSVCEQIRWKKAHEVIGEEIENHIIDQKDGFIKKGLDEETSIDKAILEMGDPIAVGAQLDRTHRPKAQWSMILLTLLMLGMGLVIKLLFTNNLNTPRVIPYSIISAVIGIGFMLAAYFIDFTILVKHHKKIFIALTIIEIMLLMFSPKVNGCKIYVSYILILFPTAYAEIIYGMRNKGYGGIIQCYLFFVIPLLIGTSAPAGSGNYFYGIICLILLIIAVSKNWFNIKTMTGLLITFTPVIVFLIYFVVVTMKLVYFNLDGYMYLIVRNIISNSQFIGGVDVSTYGKAIAPFLYTNFLLTHLIGKIGWISFIVIMTVIAIFIAYGFYLCQKQKSILGKLVSTSVIAGFTLQVMCFTASNLGFPSFVIRSGLPLISYGNIALIINMSLIGIMLSVFKSGDAVRDKLSSNRFRSTKFMEIIDGKLVIDIGIK